MTDNTYQQKQATLDTNYAQQKSQAAKYGIDISQVTDIYNQQTLQNQQDQALAGLKSNTSLDARQQALNGDVVAKTAAALKATQAEEMLAAQRDHMTDTTKLAAVQEAEYGRAMMQANAQVQTANTNVYAQGMSALGQTIPAAFGQIAQNAYNAILQAQTTGQDMVTTIAVANVNTAKAQIQAILGTVNSQIQTLTSQLQQSGAYRDAATAMADARLTPQQAYDTAISRWRTDLAAAQGGNLDALSKLTSYGQAAVNAESSVSGGTQTTIYNEVTAGLKSMADQIDAQNGINYDQGKAQLNQLQVLAQTASKQLTAQTTSADALQGYFDTAVANENSALSALSSLQGTMTAGVSSIVNIISQSALAQIQATAAIASPSASSTINSATKTVQDAQASAASSAANSLSAATTATNLNTELSSYTASAAKHIESTLTTGTDWQKNVIAAFTGKFGSSKVTSEQAGDLYLLLDDLNIVTSEQKHKYAGELGINLSSAGIPGYASGIGSAPGGWSIVGENGPEAMYVPRGATIVPYGNDPNAALVAEVRALRSEVAALRLATLAGAMHVADTVTTTSTQAARANERASYAPQPTRVAA